jgi:hypothetical protein
MRAAQQAKKDDQTIEASLNWIELLVSDLHQIPQGQFWPL